MLSNIKNSSPKTLISEKVPQHLLANKEKYLPLIGLKLNRAKSEIAIDREAFQSM